MKYKALETRTKVGLQIYLCVDFIFAISLI